MMIFIEGFDKYGTVVPNTDTTTLNTLFLQEWNTSNISNVGYQLVTGLSATGYALKDGGFSSITLTKTLPSSYTTFYCGFRFNIGGFSGISGLSFLASGTYGISIGINALGQVEVRSGNFSGTSKGTSSVTVLTNVTHYLEMAVTMSTSGAGSCAVYLDGVQVINLTSQSFATANINQLQINKSGGTGGIITYDDLYFFDNTGSLNNNVLLTSPRIETVYPNADSAVQFTPSAGILGVAATFPNGVTSVSGGKLWLRKFVAPCNCTINSISFIPNATSGTSKWKGVIYSDSAGAPNTLLSSGTEVVGVASGVTATFPLVTPQSLTGGTTYWIGWINDTSVNGAMTDTLNLGYQANNTYASGAPGTAPAMTGGQSSFVIFGNLTGMANNFPQEDIEPNPGVLAYNSDSTVGHEDLFSTPGLSTTPSAIYGVKLSGSVAKSDTGARTISLRMKSGASDGGGSLTGQAPGTSFSWLASYFETDPATGVAWNATGLNAAKIGYKIDS